MKKLFIGIVLIVFVITAIVLLQPVKDMDCVVNWSECVNGSRQATITTKQSGKGKNCQVMPPCGDKTISVAPTPISVAPPPIAVAPQPIAVAPQPIAVAPQPINRDCLVTWGNCNVNGFRDHNIISTQSGNGKNCANDAKDMPGCDCVNTWSSCNLNGVRSQTISQHKSGNGKPCALSPSCNVDCVNTWSACDVNGVRVQTITKNQAFNGKPCAPSPVCNVDCVNTWSECNAGGGRVQTITRNQKGNGKPCVRMPPCDNVQVEGEYKSPPKKKENVGDKIMKPFKKPKIKLW
jgi:hypothetical protein